MARPLIIPETINEHDFKMLYRIETNPRIRIRLLAFSHLQEGLTPVEISPMIHVGALSIRTWIHNFSREGLAGLRDKPKPGAKPRLPTGQLESFTMALSQLQEERSGGRVRGEDIRELLRVKFQVKYSLNGVYALLKRIGWVWISVRSKHPKTDQAKQEEFKKI